MGNYEDLKNILNRREENRVLILDNNNLEFCSQNDEQFPKDILFGNYDVVLIPGWVCLEISHSQKRKDYLSNMPVPVLVLYEESDYVELIENQDVRLMHLFKHAASSISPARKYFSGLNKYYSQNDDFPDNWIGDFYARGFEVKPMTNLRANAGETSILVLSYLLLHHFQHFIKQITIFSSDKGTLTIKNDIMNNLNKIGLINDPMTPISFMTTDVLLVEAVKYQWINIEDVIGLRPNKRSVIYTMKLPDGSSSRHEYVMDSLEFIKVLEQVENYHFEF